MRISPRRVATYFATCACSLLLSVGCQHGAHTVTNADQRAPLVIHNGSSEGICYVNLSPSGDASWGPDRLAHGEMLAPGSSRGWRVTPGYWDLRLWDCQQVPLLTRRRVEVHASGAEVHYP